MRMRLKTHHFAWLPMLAILLVSLAAPVWAQRVALLVGNSDYAIDSMDLRNPVNDVTALGAALRDLGFQVTEVEDQDAAGMAAALKTFERSAIGAEMALFFYAGHGVQIGGDNHLVGTEFAGGQLGALSRASITMASVREAMVRAAPQVGILILDACRNNPFTEQGLVRPGLVRDRGGAGLLIAYATDPGNVAYDGEGQNSVFTSNLLRHIRTPGLDVRLMLGRVRQEVVLDTGGRQIPWVEESVLGEHSFAAAEPVEIDDDKVAELARWRKISGSTAPQDFREYLRAYPEGLFAEFAQDRIATLTIGAAQITGPAEAILAAADRDRMSAALQALGLASDDTPESMTRALSQFQRRNGAAELSEAVIYTEAAQVSMFLAATTLQQLRTDMVALRSVNRTLDIAEDALGQIQAIAETNSDAQPILEQAIRDTNAIRRSRSVILRRLDQSRTYYDDILAQSVTFFPENVSMSLLGGQNLARDISAVGETMTENASMFLRHVAQADEARKGSYQWLADLMSES